jgi:uncharacterized protein YjbI with pentapeptide repeats
MRKKLIFGMLIFAVILFLGFVNGAQETLYVDFCTDTKTAWDTRINTPYLDNSDISYIHEKKTKGALVGDFGFTNSAISVARINNVTLWMECCQDDTDDYMIVSINDGAGFVNAGNLLPTTICSATIPSTSWGWNNINLTTLNSLDKINAAQMYLTYVSVNQGDDLQCRRAYLRVDYCAPSLTNTPWSLWTNITSCQFNNTILQSRNLTEYDSNFCGVVSNVTHYEYQEIICDYCTPNLTNTSWTDWVDVTSCQFNNTILQRRSLVQYDLNNCGEVPDVIFYNYQEIPCDFCTPSLTNTSWTDWTNETSCRANNTILQRKSLVQYDSNFCGEIGNTTFYEYREILCDFCTPILANTTPGSWYNITECRFNNTILEQRNWTQYDSNFCGETGNTTFYDYQEIPCDFCTPILTNTTEVSWYNITQCRFNNTILEQRNWTQYDSNFCVGESENTTFYDYRETACDFCTPILTNTSWTNWTNSSECTLQDKIIQTKTRIQYDLNNCEEIENKTYSTYQEIPCDYCTPEFVQVNTTCSRSNTLTSSYIDANLCYEKTGLESDKALPKKTLQCDYCSSEIQGPFYTEWSSCSEIGKKERTKYYSDLNYASCCLVTRFSSDCEIRDSIYKNTTENGICPVDINLSINKPIEEQYNTTKIKFEIESTQRVSKMYYRDEIYGNPSWTTLCTNCDIYNRTRSFKEGEHNITLKGILLSGQEVLNETSFFIDSKIPLISRTKPTRGKYTNGSDFYIKYTENNCKTLNILINEQEIFSSDCESGKNIERIVSLNLNSFNGEEIEYKFVIIDILNNTVVSKPITVLVDTITPEIKDFKNPIAGKYVYFNMTILNENAYSFNKVEYIDNSNLNPMWKTLCTTLKNNACSKKIYFSKGEHNLIIRASDDAGNSDLEYISINIA